MDADYSTKSKHSTDKTPRKRKYAARNYKHNVAPNREFAPHRETNVDLGHGLYTYKGETTEELTRQYCVFNEPIEYQSEMNRVQIQHLLGTDDIVLETTPKPDNCLNDEVRVMIDNRSMIPDVEVQYTKFVLLKCPEFNKDINQNAKELPPDDLIRLIRASNRINDKRCHNCLKS